MVHSLARKLPVTQHVEKFMFFLLILMDYHVVNKIPHLNAKLSHFNPLQSFMT